jgi:membrane protease YdiL (CAAX protease family)
MSEDSPATGNIVRIAITFEAGILLVALVLGWLFHHPPLQHIRVSWPAVFQGTVATVPLVIVIWVCANSSYRAFRELMLHVEKQIIPLFEGASSHSLLLVSIFAGLGEECLFRGLLQPGLSMWVGAPLALIVTSGMFGLAHLVTLTYAILAGLIGAYLGVVVLVTDNLLVAVIAHALYDFAALKYLLNLRRRQVGR